MPHGTRLLEKSVPSTQYDDIACITPGTKVKDKLPGTFGHLPLVCWCEGIMMR